MPLHSPLAYQDPYVTISDPMAVQKFGDMALLGNWFVFLKEGWQQRGGLQTLPGSSSASGQPERSAILFRGKEEVVLPSVKIAPKPLPAPDLVSLTSDKALYRANRDMVRLLVASPLRPLQTLRLILHLNGTPYADYPLILDKFGLCLWSMQDLPEGEYEAQLQETAADVCRFEVAEYRLAPLNAELAEQHIHGETLRYVLTVTAFGQPYVGLIEIELQERGQRVGERNKLNCNREGQCRGAVKLTGAGPYTLNIFAGERSATVPLKGSEQERRESLPISELGELRVLSLLPLPQSNSCRGMYIARGGANTEPFLVRRVVGNEVEITARVAASLLRVVVTNPSRNTFEESLYSDVKSEQVIRLPIPAPYGVVLLGALIDDKAWEGWCTILRPANLQLQCEAPKQVKPGAHINVTLKTAIADRDVPVQLIVKDQRLVTTSDPLVELAARIKQNLAQWHEQTATGEVERQLGQVNIFRYGTLARGRTMHHMVASAPSSFDPSSDMAPMAAMQGGVRPMAMMNAQPMMAQAVQMAQAPVVAPTATLSRIRMQFPEIVYNTIVSVRGQANVEVTLGEGMTRYSIEAFALSSETLDWERVETTLETVQQVFGELTVSPFAFPGDPVIGRLDVHAASGGAIVEVHTDGENVPLFFDDGSEVTHGLPIPSGSVVRFPVRPGTITSMVRDARKGGIDISERYVTAPGRLRHIARRLHLLLPGDEVLLDVPRRLEIKPMPGLERPFQVFVEAATLYPFGCVEQTSVKLLSMFTGYITNLHNEAIAHHFEAAIVVWYKRLKSMYLPNSGFSLYPPEEGGRREPDTHYAPLAVQHLLSLPKAEHAGIQQPALLETLADIAAMATNAAAYYAITYPPREVSDCHAAYLTLAGTTAQEGKDRALSFVRARLQQHNGETYVDTQFDQQAISFYGRNVATRRETAYAAATLLAAKDTADIPTAIAATNYLTAQMNEDGRLYSTIDTAACLTLLLELRGSGLIDESGKSGRVLLNGEEMGLADALTFDGKVESLRCLAGIGAAQVTTEVIEDWSTFKSDLPVEVYLERQGNIQQHFSVGDELDLVIRVARYEPGLLAHVCLPDALARVVGGAQVKRFSLDFQGKSELRVPLAAVGSTQLPAGKNVVLERSLQQWLDINQEGANTANTQHWAVIVRNMFKEEQIGNPGLLEVIVA
ncbi:MAG TPA: hypothetical protein VNG51_07370 [Ktedonobacteraceae bacterium]|nr:hypothetical protein [Ktedonobacteraceae bacterium]